MKLSIGILAHNEEGYVGATIASLLSQSIFSDATITKQVVVVANGCKDATAAEARAALSAATAPGYSFKVLDIDTPGKANAWNVFVHEASDAGADYFVLLDADIEFASADAVARLIRHLDADDDLMIAPDQPLKKFASGGAMRFLIRMLQKSGSDDEHAISGQLYAARAGALRAVRMPLGVVVEDGFLRAMILTSSFGEAEDKRRIRRAPGVSHYYAPYETLAELWRYERRQAAGTAINRFLYDEFASWRAKGLAIAAEIDRRNKADPHWLDALVAARAKTGGVILTPPGYAFRRLRRLARLKPRDFFKAPLYLVAVLYDLAVAVDASRQLRTRAKRGGHWESIRTA